MKIFGRDRQVNAFEVDAGDGMFLDAEEHTFLFFGATHSIVRMLSGKKENYTAGTITFRELGLKPTDLMGQRCSQCKQPVEEVHTACVGLHQSHVKQVMHEACFPRWFASQDKEKLKPYRFCRPRKKTLIVEGSSFQLQVNQGDKVDEYTFEALSEIPYSSVASLTELPQSAPGPASTAGMSPSMAGSTGESVAAPAGGDPGMSAWGPGGATAAGGTGQGMGMTVVGGEGGGLASLAAPSPAGGEVGMTTRTVIICPHCSQPVMLSFEAKKAGE